MTRTVVVLLISFFAASPLAGGAPDRATLDRVRSLTLEGLHYLYDFDVDHANRKFDEAIAIEPRHPRPYMSRAFAPLWKFVVTRAPSDYEYALRLITEAIDVAEKYLDDIDDQDADALTCLGTSYGYRAYVDVATKSYLKAAWDGKRSYDYLSQAVNADPHFYDAYLGLGLYHFAVATIPKPLQWIIGILGVEGDRELGIREIELAARKGIYNSPEAKYFLVQFYPWFKGDFETSEKLIDELLRDYPTNTVFHYAKGFMKLRQNNIAAALPYFLKMKELDNRFFAIINKFAELRVGECYFRLGDFVHARESYMAFLAVNGHNQFEALASYHAGLAAELLGDRASALPLYLRAKNLDAVHGDDVYAARHAAKLLASPLSLVDSLLIAARNFHRSGAYNKALDMYSDIVGRYALTDDQRAETLYRMGECFYDQDKYDEAAEQFHNVLRLNVRSEQWVMPWAHFMLGQIALKKKDTATAKKEFELVSDYDNYDHKNWLNFRTEQELEKMKNVNGDTR